MEKWSFNSLFLKKIKVLWIKHLSEITWSLPSIIHSFYYLLNVYVCQPAFLSFSMDVYTSFVQVKSYIVCQGCEKGNMQMLQSIYVTE